MLRKFGIGVTMTYNFVFDDKLPPQMPLPRPSNLQTLN